MLKITKCFKIINLKIINTICYKLPKYLKSIKLTVKINNLAHFVNNFWGKPLL